MISPLRRYFLAPVAVALLAPAAIVTSATSALAAPVASTGTVAAIINGHQIPISTYRLFYKVSQHAAQAQTPPQAVVAQTRQEIVYNELVREYAVAHHITVTAADVNTQERHDEATSGGVRIFQQRLKTFGLTLAEYRQLLIPNVLDTKVEAIIAPTKTNAQAIALAQRLIVQLQHGANFAVLAKQYSNDPGSAAKGGDLGTVYPHQMVAPFDQASFHAPIGKFVLVHSQFGYHIVEVLSRGTGLAPGSKSGAKVQTAHVRHILISTQPNQAKFLAWLHQLQNRAHIKWLA